MSESYSSQQRKNIPTWAIKRPKNYFQILLDFLTIPFRLVLLPDTYPERLHLTSLRAERFAAVIPLIKGDHLMWEQALMN